MFSQTRLFLIRKKILTLCALAAAINSCKAMKSSKTQALDQHEASIAVENFSDVDISGVKIIPQSNIPKAVMVVLRYDEKTKDGNLGFVSDLANIIGRINQQDRLTENEGYNQRIDLIVFYSRSRHRANLIKLIDNPRSESYLRFLQFHGDRLGHFVQDWGEFAQAKVAGRKEYVHLLLDTGTRQGIGNGLHPVNPKILEMEVFYDNDSQFSFC